MFDMMPFEHSNNRMDRFFDSFFGNAFNGLGSFGGGRTDIVDKGKNYVLQAEMPGFDKGDISIDINDDILTIKAEHKSQNEEKNDKGEFIRRERSYGSYVRSFNVSGVNTDQISASYNNGILELVMPKKEPQAPKGTHIDIH